MKTSELTDVALRYAVALAEGDEELVANAIDGTFAPDDYWAQGGPIIEREALTLDYDAHDTDKLWEARRYAYDGTLLHNEYGPTPLVAAMRCYVASKLGDEVDVPDELIS